MKICSRCIQPNRIKFIISKSKLVSFNYLTQFKQLILKNFSGSIDFLLGKMRDYALSKKWIVDIPQEEKMAADIATNDDFYLISVAPEEYEKKKELIKTSIDYLNDLKASVENPESKLNINSMLNHLSQYQNIMRKVTVALKDKSDETEEDEGNKKRIFVIMDELELMKKNIKEGVVSITKYLLASHCLIFWKSLKY